MSWTDASAAERKAIEAAARDALAGDDVDEQLAAIALFRDHPMARDRGELAKALQAESGELVGVRVPGAPWDARSELCREALVRWGSTNMSVRVRMRMELVAEGRAAPIIDLMRRLDGAWVESHFDEIVASNPGLQA